MFLLTDEKIYRNEELTSDRVRGQNPVVGLVVTNHNHFPHSVFSVLSPNLCFFTSTYFFTLFLSVSSFFPIPCLLVIWTPTVPPSLSFFLSYHSFVLLVAMFNLTYGSLIFFCNKKDGSTAHSVGRNVCLHCCVLKM